jgi:hypothetical protein
VPLKDELTFVCLVGQDLVALAAFVPLLLASMWLTAHGSTRGLLLWAGSLLWAAYSYYFYIVGGFNALFLIYIAMISTSLSGLLSVRFAMGPEAFKVRLDEDGRPTDPGALRRVAEGNALVRIRGLSEAGRA